MAVAYLVAEHGAEHGVDRESLLMLSQFAMS